MAYDLLGYYAVGFIVVFAALMVYVGALGLRELYRSEYGDYDGYVDEGLAQFGAWVFIILVFGVLPAIVGWIVVDVIGVFP